MIFRKTAVRAAVFFVLSSFLYRGVWLRSLTRNKVLNDPFSVMFDFLVVPRPWSLIVRIASCVSAVVFFGVGLQASQEAESVVVVYNLNEPESKSLAEFYAEKRSIPSRNLIGLDTPSAETITLQQYVESIHNPLLFKLLEDGWITGVMSPGEDPFGRKRLSVGIVNLSYLVTIRGIPLRFENNPELLEPEAIAKLPEALQLNQGGVDSELALIAGPPGLTFTAFIPNPLFDGKGIGSSDAKRVARVSRLDGPSDSSVRRVIEGSLAAEQSGLRGRAYFDYGGGPHAKGNEWLKAASELAAAAFFDTDSDSSPRRLDERDRLDAPAIYMGWYRYQAYGPWADKRWNAPRGAIGFHLHSYSGLTVRSESKSWLGPLTARGYAATFGNVYEPYLDYTHRPEIVLRELLAGQTFGEAITRSIPVFSWMGVALGDPLYRPFAVSLEEQMEQATRGDLLGYVYLREANRVRQSAGDEAALSVLRDGFLKDPSLALALALARELKATGNSQAGADALRVIRFINTFSFDELVVVSQIADFLRAEGESQMALEVYEKLLLHERIPKPLHISLLEKGSRVASEAGNYDLQSRWSMEATLLKKPPEKK